MDFSWQMPEFTEGMRRAEVGMCIVTPDLGTDLIDIALAIAEIAILAARSYGLGITVSSPREAEGRPPIDDEGRSYIREEFMERGLVDLDYWGGTTVKLFAKKQADGTLAISINAWSGRQEGWGNIPEAIKELDEVLHATRETLVQTSPK